MSVFLLNWTHTEKQFIVVCSWTHTIKFKDRLAYCVFKYVIFLCVCVCVGELLEYGTKFLDSRSSSITEQGISISSTPISSILPQSVGSPPC